MKLALNSVKDSTNNIIDQIEKTIDNLHITKTLVPDYIDSIIVFLPKLAIGIIGFFAIFKIINIISKTLKNILAKRNIDPSVIKFIALLTSITLKTILAISTISFFGIETTSLVAMLGAAGLAVGFALQGTLQNFAGGVIILILKPFKTGDDVEFGGERGIVKEVQLFSTIIEKFGTNENLIVPNSSISSSSLTNWSRERNRRIDIIFGIGYGADIKITKDLIIAEANKDSRVINPSETTVYVNDLASSSVNLELRVWCNPIEYLNTRSDMIEMIYNTLNANNIEIPFTQITIHKS